MKTTRTGIVRWESGRRADRFAGLPAPESLEPRLAMATGDGFAIAVLQSPTAADYPTQVLALAPVSGGVQPTSVTFAINGGTMFSRSGAAIEQLNTWAGTVWGVRLVDDQGAAIYPANAAWKVDVSAQWNDSTSSTKSIYYTSVDTQFVSGIVMPALDWSAGGPDGIGGIRAGAYEEVATITIDRTKATTVTLPLTTLVNNVPVVSTYSVMANNAGVDASVWKVVTATVSADKRSLVLAIDPTNDSQDAGMMAIAIKDTANVTAAPRYLGIQVTGADGRLPVKPAHVAVGAVNQNGVNDLAFFRGTAANDPTGFKQMDYQYIYLNNGPLKLPDGNDNWSAWRRFTAPYGYEGSKLVQSLREAWKGGSIPTVVYYNIMCPNESAEIAAANIRNQAFIGSYFEDLKFTMDTLRGAAKGAAVSLIMEPDFLAYMMQSTYSDGVQADPSTVTLGYDIVQLAKDKGLIAPDSTLVGGAGSTLVDFVHVINEGVRYLSTKAGTTESVNLQFGWKFNLWANQAQSAPTPTGSWNQGISKVTDFFLAHPDPGESPADAFARGQRFIDKIATDTAIWYFKAGVTSAGMDFMALDKYGTDGGNPYNTAQTTPGFTDPANARWLFNADHWTNYLRYAKQISTELAAQAQVGAMPIRLWQIPVGHVNTSQTASPFTGRPFAPISNSQQNPAVGNSPAVAAYEDSAVTWIFGDRFTGQPATSDVGQVLAVATNGVGGFDPTKTYAVTFSGGGGTGAEGVAVIDAQGILVGIQVTKPGAGYTSAPTVTLSGGPSGSTFTALIRQPAAAYWATNVAADSLVSSAAGVVSWGSHIRALRDAGVEAILFGPGLPNATNGGGYADQPAQDDFFWASATQAYLRKPLPLIDPIQQGSVTLMASARPVTRTIGSTPTALVEVSRSGDLQSPLDLPVTVVGGTAAAGIDYRKRDLESTVIHFAPNQVSALVPLKLLPTRAAQPNEQLSLRIGGALPTVVPALVRVLLGTTARPGDSAGSVALDSVQGRRLFNAATTRRAAIALLSHATTQVGPDGAGFAAAAVILNAAGVPRPGSSGDASNPSFDPTSLAANGGVQGVLGGAAAGRRLTLDTLGRVLGAFPIRTTVVHAESVALAQFRSQVNAALGARTGFVIANYDRSAVGEGTGSHFSAIAAYHAATDRFLLVGADRARQSPVWVTARSLFEGMRRVDPSSGVTGGYVVVRR